MMKDWAVNIYRGRTHVLTEYFRNENAARFYHNNVALRANQSAHLMQHQGNFKWRQVAERRRVLHVWKP